MNITASLAFHKTEGIAQVQRLADYVFGNAFVPLRRTKSDAN